MRTSLFAVAALLAVSSAAAAPTAKPEFETVVLEALKGQTSPAAAPVKGVPAKPLVLARTSKVCRLVGMERDQCRYTCSDGSEHSRPIEVAPPLPGDPFGSPRVSCPQIIIPF